MNTTANTPVITADELFKNWQGHRALSRRVLEAFPEKELFEFSIGGMRPYSQLAGEMLGIASAGINGIVTGKWETKAEWDHFSETFGITTNAGFLEAWDSVTEQINEFWPQIPAEHFHETVNAYGLYSNTVTNTIVYLLDNEVHHRGQGYVYLRALGIGPPAFWER